VLFLAAGIGEAKVDELDVLSLSILRTSAGLVMRVSFSGARLGLRCIAKRAWKMSENYAISCERRKPGAQRETALPDDFAPSWRNHTEFDPRMVQRWVG
jgi:hypothetical protein